MNTPHTPHSLLLFSSYLATGEAQYLAGLPPRAKDSIERLYHFECSSPHFWGNRDNLTDHDVIGILLAEFQRLQSVSNAPLFLQLDTVLQYRSFVNYCWGRLVDKIPQAHHRERPYECSHRTAFSGLLLWIKYLRHSAFTPSAHMREFQTKQSGFRIENVLLECFCIAVTFFDNPWCSHQLVNETYRSHVLDAVGFDVADLSPIDYVAVAEELELEEERYLPRQSSDDLHRLMCHEIVLCTSTAARLAGAALMATVFASPNGPAERAVWIEENWSKTNVDYLRLTMSAVGEVRHFAT